MAEIVYIESSIISYLTARPSRDIVTAARQAITIEWWSTRLAQYDPYISALVETEISTGDPVAAAQRMRIVANIPSLAITDDAQRLASDLVATRAVPANSVEDALHIAIAATQGANYLLTWNFKHINNAETKAKISQAIEAAGFDCPILCSPEELGGNVDDE